MLDQEEFDSYYNSTCEAISRYQKKKKVTEKTNLSREEARRLRRKQKEEEMKKELEQIKLRHVEKDAKEEAGEETPVELVVVPVEV